MAKVKLKKYIGLHPNTARDRLYKIVEQLDKIEEGLDNYQDADGNIGNLDYFNFNMLKAARHVVEDCAGKLDSLT